MAFWKRNYWIPLCCWSNSTSSRTSLRCLMTKSPCFMVSLCVIVIPMCSRSKSAFVHGKISMKPPPYVFLAWPIGHQAALEVLKSLETHPWLAPMRPWLAKIHEVWPQAGRFITWLFHVVSHAIGSRKMGWNMLNFWIATKKSCFFLKKGLANLDTRVLRFLAAHILASSIKNIGACLIGNTMWEYNARPSRNRWPMGFLGDVWSLPPTRGATRLMSGGISDANHLFDYPLVN